MSRFLPKALVLSILMASLSGTVFLISKQNVGFGTDQALVNIGPKPGVARPDRALPRSSELQQYTAGGHVLGFRENGVVIASGSHVLSVDFMNARSVSPASEEGLSSLANGQRSAPTLGKVTYRDLWDGISVVYEKTEFGVVKSTYNVQATRDGTSLPVDEIRLRYNVPARVDGNGDLVLTLAMGEMRETRPLAWQETEGGRVSVDVGYRLLGEREVGIRAGDYDSRYDLVVDPILIWNTFLGGADADYGVGVAMDASGNVYAIGTSAASWGDPIRAFTPGGEFTNDAFVAKLDKNGNLLWNTFLGGTGSEEGLGIAVDTSGNVYVTGFSEVAWGTGTVAGPEDAFVAKLNTSGTLQWNTFLGGSSYDEGYAIALDTDGNPCVTGDSYGTWGTPRLTPAGNTNAFVAKLDKVFGTLIWNTFLGGDYDDNGSGIAVDTGENVFITGQCETSWGTNIIDGFVGDDEDEDTFVAKLDPDGYYLWNTFMGSASGDATGYGIAVDTSGVYIVGVSDSDWGIHWENPIRAFDGEADEAFVAKLNTNGVRQWHTFLGGEEYDSGNGIAVDTSGHVYVTGSSEATWGSPLRPFSGTENAFAAKLDGNGALQWNTFLGGGYVNGFGIAVDTGAWCYVVGHSGGTWGSPKRAFTAGEDAFVAKIGPGARVDFNRDGEEDILWRYQAQGAYQGINCVWLMNQTEGLASIPLGTALMEAGTTGMLRMAAPTLMSRTPLDGGNPNESTRSSLSPLRDRDVPVLRHRMAKWSPMGIGRVHTPPAKRTKETARPCIPTMKDVESHSAADSGTAGPGIMETASVAISGYLYPQSVSDLDWEIAGAGDFDGNGSTDILWRNYGSGGYSGINCIWYMSGEAVTGYGYPYKVLDLNWRIGGTGDFNGDGKTDILWRNYGSGEYSGFNCIWYMDGEEVTGYGYPFRVLDVDWKIVGTGDFDSDGNTDILWRNNGSGTQGGFNCIWYMNREAVLDFGFPYRVLDLNWQIAGTGDFNKDGYTDILYRYYGGGGLQGMNCIWYLQGDVLIASDFPMVVPDTNWRIVNR